MQSTELTKKCPNCPAILTYKSKMSFNKAIKKQACCPKCNHKKRLISSDKIIPMILLNQWGKKNRQIAKILNINHRTTSEYLAKFDLKSSFANYPIDKVSEDTAKCSKCEDIRPLVEFQRGRRG